MEIIGITGSFGKSSLCYILSSYLKYIGKKVVCYSSIEIDSPKSDKTAHQSMEVVIKNKEVLESAIREANEYNADFLILEINEEMIEKGIFDDVPFTYRVLTNIKRMDVKDDFDKYKEEILSFLLHKNKEVEDKIILYLDCAMDISDFTKVKEESAKVVITLGTRYICNKKGYEESDINYLMHETPDSIFSSINGLNFDISTINNTFNISTNLIFPYNAINILEVYSIINDLKLLDKTKFISFLKDINIPGRSEVIKINDRFIMISPTLSPELEELYKLKENGEINDIILVTASIGQGFSTWEEKYNSKAHKEHLSRARKFSMEYASRYANYIYLTSSDPANSDPYEIASEMKSYINKESIDVIIDIDRYSAIKQAIINSRYNDFILISGRGNRSIYCIKDKMLHFTDSELVKKALTEIGWYYEYK